MLLMALDLKEARAIFAALTIKDGRIHHQKRAKFDHEEIGLDLFR
jgi:hypothetical protein